MVAPKKTRTRERLMEPWWRKARIGARLIQKRKEGYGEPGRDFKQELRDGVREYGL